MKRTLVAVTAALAGCTIRSSTTPAATSTPAMSPPTVFPPVATVLATSTVVEASDDGGLFGQGASPDAAAPSATAPAAAVTAPSPTMLLPVPPLPADLHQVRPSTPQSRLEPDEHDHDHDHAELTAGDVAAEWIAAVYTGRYDDPPNAAADALRPLAASDTLADETLAMVGPVDVDGGEARWPYIVDIVDAGDGWWQATVLVRSTRSGQVGPTSTPIAVRVHVTGQLLVDDWDEQR